MNILLINATLFALAVCASAGGKSTVSVGPNPGVPGAISIPGVASPAGIGSIGNRLAGPTSGSGGVGFLTGVPGGVQSSLSTGIGAQGQRATALGFGTGNLGTTVAGLGTNTLGLGESGVGIGAGNLGLGGITGGLSANAGPLGTGVGSLGTGIGSIGSGVGSFGTGIGSVGSGVGSLGTGVRYLSTAPLSNQAGLSGAGLRGDLGVLGQLSQSGITGRSSFTPGAGGVIGSFGIPGVVGGENLSPKPFSYDYQSADEQGNVHFKQEAADGSGNVLGVYGYTDSQGLYRQVQYQANQEGFKAIVQTNEPGTDGKENPADVQMIVEKPPPGVQPQYGAGMYQGAGIAGIQYGNALMGIPGGAASGVPGAALQGAYGGRPFGSAYGGDIVGRRGTADILRGVGAAYGLPATAGTPAGLGGITGGAGIPSGLLGGITGIPASGASPALGGISGIASIPGSFTVGQGVRSGKSGY